MRLRSIVLSAFVGFAAFLIPTQAFAQATTFGVQGGINLANVSLKTDDTDVPDFKSRTLGVFGGFVARDFNPKAGLQIDFLYSQKGTKATGSEDGIPIEFEASVDYIEIPVLIRGSFGDSSMKGRVFAGPSFGFKVRDHAQLTGGGMVFEGDDVAKFKGSEVGFVLGGAVQFGQVFVDVRYNWGLTNIADDDSGEEAKTRTLGIMIGFQFK